LLVAAAVEAGDYQLALTRSERALSLAASPARRVEHADLLLRADRSDEARALLAALRRDAEMPVDVRAKAYYLSVKDARSSRQYEEAEALAEEWLALEPSEKGAAWVRVDALLWLGRAAEAVAVARGAELEPEDLGEARLLAHVYLRGLSPAEALAEIVRLSDRFDRADESLEGLVIAAWTNARGGISDELEQRAALSLNEFVTRFPDSKAQARAVTIDELSNILKEQASAAKELDAMGSDVVAGRIPVSLWALAAGRSVAQMWSGLRVLPVASGDDPQTTADTKGAEQAFGRGAVWDASALVVGSRLDAGIQEATRRALPRSVIAQSVMQDIDFAAVDALDERTSEDEMRLTWDAETSAPVAFMLPSEEIDRERRALREAHRVAKELEVVPDTAKEKPTGVDALVPEVVDVETMLRAGLFGTLAIAIREELPVYCDDRVLRVLYRQAGVPAFGTVALLRVMQARGIISEEERHTAIAALEQAGAIDLAGRQ
jgi:tetratricopeptide (TPR) repeat protein